MCGCASKCVCLREPSKKNLWKGKTDDSHLYVTINSAQMLKVCISTMIMSSLFDTFTLDKKGHLCES